MTSIRCLSCGAETNNGLALCDLCQRKARVDLEFLPVYFRNLARWRPGRAGSRQVPGSRVLYDGETKAGGDRISDALDAARSALTTWARLLIEDREFPRPLTRAEAYITGELEPDELEQLLDHASEAVTLLCAGLSRWLTSIATREWAGDFVALHRPDDDERRYESDGIGYHERRLRSLTEQLVPGWYAGRCMRKITMEGDACGGKTYVTPGLTWANCSICGNVTYARDHLAVILTEARSWAAPPKPLAEALVALVDGEMSVLKLRNRIVQWSKRGHLEAVRATTYDRKRYRLGDVLDRLYVEGPTQLAESAIPAQVS